MSSGQTDTPTSRPAKPQRVLACILCQQRKIKCNRTFPCSNCTRSGAQCVPATLQPRKRRRRFAERDLLNRLRTYEDLLRKNKIEFEPLHPGSGNNKTSPSDAHFDDESEDEHTQATIASVSSPSTTSRPEKTYEAKSFWHAMNRGFQGADDDSDSQGEGFAYQNVQQTWDQVHPYSDSLLFGSGNADVDLSPLQPDPVHIFRLWQIYLDNVNPLLKITHTPSLQGRIIEAANNTAIIGRELEALMFSIYCMAITSLTIQECQSMFGVSKKDLLTRFQFACQQALGKCEFLRTSERDCLTALYLLLLSAMTNTDPRSMSSMLGIVVRIAQRLGLYSETENSKRSPVEAELGRRLWWSLILFDARISEMSNHKEGLLLPTWDCNVPSNISDSDLRPEMKVLPTSQTTPTEAIFVAVRSEMGKFVGRTNFHLDFTNPALKQLAPVDEISQQLKVTSLSDDSEIDGLEQLIEEKYLRHCDEENPLHYMTIWHARGYLGRCRLIEFYSKCAISPSAAMTGQSPPSSQTNPTEAQRESAYSHALKMLSCDTKIMASPLTKGYLWMMDHNFPVIAYFQIVQHLRRRPMIPSAANAWAIMDENYESRFVGRVEGYDRSSSPLIRFFSKVILGAWDARDVAQQQRGGDQLLVPRIVTGLRMAFSEEQTSQDAAATHYGGTLAHAMFGDGTDGMDVTSIDFGSHVLPQNMRGFDNYAAPPMSGPGLDLPTQAPFDTTMYPLDFSFADWMEKPPGM